MADVQELNINSTTYDIKAKSVVDTNSGAVKFWTGTRTDYDTLVSGGITDANTVYVTDNGLFIGTTEVSNISSNRNIGEIVPSIVPLTDAGLHLLDGTLINGAGIYADFVSAIGDIYDNTTTRYSNVNKFGSVVDTNGVLTNITSSNYVTIPSSFSPNTNTWEIIIKFKRTNSTAGTITGGGYSWAVNINNISGHLELYISSNNSSWDISNATQGTTVIQNDIDYWYKVVFTGTSYVLYLSTTGEFSGEETTEVTITSSTKIHSGNTTCLGKWAVFQTNNTYTGIIDLNGCYININGSRWWKGREASGFTDESSWQTSVTTYGVCGKFVYDSVANTVRLPKITGIIEGTTDLTALGDLVQAGLPNITASITTFVFHNPYPGTPSLSGAMYKNYATNTLANVTSSTSGGFHDTGVNFSAYRSNSIYGNSSTVQPQTIKVLYYIVIATTTKTEIEVDIDAVATDLNGKADCDLVNVNDSGTSLGGSWAMPSSSYDNLTAGASGSTYTAPANGWFYLRNITASQNTYAVLQNNSKSELRASNYIPSGWNNPGVILPVVKNDIISIAYSGSVSSSTIFRFYYAQGSESEAN